MAIKGDLRVDQLVISLFVQDAAAAADFYRDVLGATEIQRHFAPNPAAPPEPEPICVEMRLAGAFLTVQQENSRWREAPRPDWPRSPLSAGAPSVAFALYVDDVDDIFARAVAAGASPQLTDGTPEDTYWGDRVVQIHDPFGHFWRIQTRVEDVAREELAARFEAARASYRAAKGLGRRRDEPAASPE